MLYALWESFGSNVLVRLLRRIRRLAYIELSLFSNYFYRAIILVLERLGTTCGWYILETR